MKASCFIYTRTFYADFHVLYKPRVHEKILSLYEELVEDLVDKYDIYKDKCPRWVYVQYADSLLWGVVCANSMLGDKYKDYLGRPIRGFYGIVLTDVKQFDVEFPYDISFFSELYAKIIEPIWETRGYHTSLYDLDWPIATAGKSLVMPRDYASIKGLDNHIIMPCIEERSSDNMVDFSLPHVELNCGLIPHSDVETPCKDNY